MTAKLPEQLTYFGEWHNIPLLYCLFWYHPSVNKLIKQHFNTSRELAFFVIDRKQYLFISTGWLDTVSTQISSSNPVDLLNKLKYFYSVFPRAKQILFDAQKVDYSILSNEKLALSFRRIIDTIQSVTPFDQYCMITEPFYLNEFEWYLKEQLRQISKEELFNEIRTILTTPTKSTSPQIEELALINLVLKSRKNELATQDINSHLATFGWLPLFLFGKEWDSNHVYSEIERLKKDPKLLERKKAIENYSENLQLKIDLIMEQFPQKSLWPDLMREVGFIRNEAETIISLGTQTLIPIYRECYRRLNCKEEDLSTLTPEEIISALNGQNNVAVISCNRKSASVCITNVNELNIISGAEALTHFKKIYVQPKALSDSSLLGTCASLGKARGKAKIILSIADISKFDSGNILVAEATCIDYVPIMRKAAAIVTSMGGLTSHAAIVSRELGVPCIVGVKNIHNKLKDGQDIYVDADHGIIRVLN